MIDFRALIRVFDWFFPVDVISAVLLIFAMENVLDYYFGLYVPDQYSGLAWFAVYIFGIALIAVVNILTAEPDELEDLEEDFNDV